MFLVVNTKPSGKDVERYRTDFYYDDSVVKADAARCPACGFFIGMLEPVPPYRVHLETWGVGFGDVAFWLDDFLVTQRFADAFAKSGLRGLTGFVLVKVMSCRKHRRIAEPCPVYLRAMPQLGGAKIDVAASGVEWSGGVNPLCTTCLRGPGVLQRWKSVVVDESTWNGDDIFYPFGIPGTLVVTSRFAHWAETTGVSNLILENAMASSHDFYPRGA